MASGGLLGGRRKAEAVPQASDRLTPVVRALPPRRGPERGCLHKLPCLTTKSRLWPHAQELEAERSLLSDEQSDRYQARSPTLADDGRGDESYALENGEHEEMLEGTETAGSEAGTDGEPINDLQLNAVLANSQLDETEDTPALRAQPTPAQHGSWVSSSVASAAAGGPAPLPDPLRQLQLFKFKPPADLAAMERNNGRLHETVPAVRERDVSYLADKAAAASAAARHGAAAPGRPPGGAAVAAAELFFSISVPDDERFSASGAHGAEPARRLVAALGGADAARRAFGVGGGSGAPACGADGVARHSHAGGGPEWFGDLSGAHAWLRELIAAADEPRPPGRADALRVGAALDDAMLAIELNSRAKCAGDTSFRAGENPFRAGEKPTRAGRPSAERGRGSRLSEERAGPRAGGAPPRRASGAGGGGEARGGAAGSAGRGDVSAGSGDVGDPTWAERKAVLEGALGTPCAHGCGRAGGRRPLRGGA